MTSVITKNAFRLSRSGHARQLVLLCHGGWYPEDGYTDLPKGMLIYFYREHGDFTAGLRFAKEILGAQKQAYQGQIIREFVAPAQPPKTKKRDFDKEVEKLRSDYIAHNRGVIRAVQTEGRKTKRTQVYNYRLSYYGSQKTMAYADEVIWARHISGKYDEDVDLMFMQIDPIRHKIGIKRRRHLSDAIELATKANGGKPYEVFHFCPCRFVENQHLVEKVA